MKKIRSLLMLMLVFALTAGYAFAEDVAVGDAAPKIILNDIKTNQPTNFNETFKGKVSVIVYMQTSCAACRKELEALKTILDFAPELNIVAISVDAGGTARIKKYIEHYSFPFTFLHDPSFATPELFGFSFTPATVIIGKDGKIAYLKGGYRKGDEKKVLEIAQDLLKR